MKKQSIIWDWNGTLLNDVDYCVACMNIVLAKHDIPLITADIYRDKFTFPVKDYYSAIGFDFTKIDFEIPAMEFIEEYYANISDVGLHQNVISLLEFFKGKKYRQFSLSAMEHGQLVNLLKEKNIFHYFDGIQGINDHYAHSKVEMGKMLLKEQKIDTESAIMIGDTIHDFEVASHLGIDCVLYDHGHQNTDRLLTVTQNVISDLETLKSLIS